MNVYLAHSGPAPSLWTAAWARTYAPQALRLPCARDDDYARYFAMLWARGPFILVEHDVVPWPGAVEELAACAHPWCVFAYEAGTQFARDNSGVPLGCVKFAPAELGECPVQPLPGGLYPDWGALDGLVSSALLTRNSYPHQHTPAVAHIKLLKTAIVLQG